MAHTEKNVPHEQGLPVCSSLKKNRALYSNHASEDLLWDRRTFSPLGRKLGHWVWWLSFPWFVTEVNERAQIRILKFLPTLFAPINLLHSKQPHFTISCLVSEGLRLSILFFSFV